MVFLIRSAMKVLGSLALVLALFQLGVSAAAAPEEPPTCGVGEAFPPPLRYG